MWICQLVSQFPNPSWGERCNKQHCLRDQHHPAPPPPPPHPPWALPPAHHRQHLLLDQVTLSNQFMSACVTGSTYEWSTSGSISPWLRVCWLPRPFSWLPSSTTSTRWQVSLRWVYFQVKCPYDHIAVILGHVGTILHMIYILVHIMVTLVATILHMIYILVHIMVVLIATILHMIHMIHVD